MNSIDRRSIELEFDNSKFEKNTRSTIKTLNDLDSALEMKNSTKELSKLEQLGRHFSLKNIEDNVERISSSFTVLGRTAFKIKDEISNAFAGIVFSAKRYADEYIGLLSTMNQAGVGFAKYSKYTSSVRTIQSALPDTDLKTITDALDDLNKYTDETSYDFTEMVASIGKFTANGVALWDAVEAMKGIGNEAAKSGAGIQEANRAMYNFAQALATGSVKLIDWKSIENANMATKEFKEQIIETAVELGTLKKQGDKVLTKKGSKVDYTTFSTTLNEAWFTSDVLTKVLGKYADTTTEFGLAAFHAAQEAKTFSEAIDAVKDAASSGWRKTWELVFGNIDEATKLFTGLANKLIEITDVVSEWRNELLQGWRDLGGREDLIQGLTDAFDGLLQVINAVGDGIKMVFPGISAENIASITKRVSEFGKTFKGLFVTEKVIYSGRHFNAQLESVFEDLNGILKRGSNGDDVKKLQERLIQLGYLDEAGADGIFGPKTEAALKKFQEEAGIAVDGIYGKESHSKIGEKTSVVAEEFERITKTIEENTPLYEKLTTIFGGLAAVARIVGRVFNFIWNVIKTVGKALSPIADTLLTVLTGISEMFINLDKDLEVGTLFSDWLETIAEWLKPVTKWLENAGDAFLRFFGFKKDEEDANSETMTFAKLVDNIKQKLKDSGALDTFANTIDRIRNAFAAAKEKMSEWFETAKQWFTEKFLTKTNDDGTEEIISMAEVWEKVGNAIAVAIEAVINAVAWAVDNIPVGWEKLKAFFKDLFSGVDLSGTLSTAWQSIVEFATNIWGVIASLLGFGGDDTPARGSANRKSGGSKHGVKDRENQKKELQKTFDFFEWLANAWETFKSEVGNIFEGVLTFIEKHDLIGKASGIIAALNGLFIGKAILNVTNLGKGVIKIGKIWSKAQLNKEKTKKWEAIADTLKSLALVIGVIVAAIVILGKLDEKELEQGQWMMGGIVGFVVAFVALSALLPNASAQKGLKSVGSTLKGLAAALGIIVAAIWVLGRMDVGQFASGLVKLAVTLLVVGFFIKKLSGMSFNMKGLKELAICIAILVGSVIVLGMFTSWETFARGIIGLIGIMTVLVVGLRIISKRANSIKLKGLIGMAVAIAILSEVVVVLGMMPVTMLAKGIGALAFIAGIMAGLAAVFGTVGKDLKVGPILAIAGVLAGLMLVLSYCMTMVKDVDPKVMLAFGASLAIGLGAIVGAIILVNKVGGGVGGMASGAAGIAAALSILIADLVILVGVIGTIDEATDGGLVSAIESGGEVLSALAAAMEPIAIPLGLLVAACAALAKLKIDAGSMVSGAAGIAGAIDILVADLVLLVGAIGAINEGTNGNLTEAVKSGGEVFTALADAIRPIEGPLSVLVVATAAIAALHINPGSMLLGAVGIAGAIDVLVADLVLLVGAIGTINEGTNGNLTEAIKSGGEVLAALGGAIGGFAGSVAAAFDAKVKEQLNADMVAFGEAVDEFSGKVSGLGDQKEQLETDTKAAIDIAEIIRDYFVDMKSYPIDYSAMDGYATAPAEISTDMTNFGTAIKTLRDGIRGLGSQKGLDDDISKAFDITDSVKTFFDSIADKMPEGDGLKEYNDKLSSLFTQTGTFGETVSGLSTNLSGLFKSHIIENTTVATVVMGSIKRFFETVANSDIEPEKTGWAKFFSTEDETKTSSFFIQVESLGRALTKVSTAFAGLSSGTFEADAGSAEGVMRSIAGFMSFIATDESMGWLKEIDVKNARYSPIAIFSGQIDRLKTSVGNFDEYTRTIDVDHAEHIAKVIGSIAEALALVGNGGDSEASATGLTNAMNTLSESLPQFEQLGYDIAISICNGMGRSSDMVNAAASALKNAILKALSLTEDEINNALVITPVVDTSSIEAARRSLSGRSISVGASSKGAAKAIGSAEGRRDSVQNIRNDISNNSTVNVTGNTFEIKQEDDINKLANRIAALVNQQQRGFGAPIKVP